MTRTSGETEISTHAPRVRRDWGGVTIATIQKISTHAPRVRRDGDLAGDNILLEISTHAPRVRRDQRLQGTASVESYFYSRASCEARRRPVRGLHNW